MDVSTDQDQISVDLAPSVARLTRLYERGHLDMIAAQEAQLVAAFPKASAIALLLGAAQAGLGKTEAAIGHFRRSLEIDPLLLDAYNNLGVLLNSQNQIAPAVKCFVRALMVMPGSAAARYNLGLALHKTGAGEMAARHYRCATVADPLYRDAYYNLGISNHKIGAFAGAIDSVRKCLLLQPGFFKGYNNLASSLSDIGRVEEALRHFDRALVLQSDDPETHHNRGLALLKKGEFSAAWKACDWRWLRPGAAHIKPHLTAPEWHPETPSRRLLLWAEQGVGDEILCASVIPELRAQCEQLTVLADRRLIPLMARSSPADVVFQARTEGFSDAGFDAQISIVSAGKYLRASTARIQAVPQGYLRADPTQTGRLRAAIYRAAAVPDTAQAIGRPRICGLSWRSESKDTGSLKSLSLAALAAAVAHPQLIFVNLQYGDTLGERQQLKLATGIDVIDLPMVDNFKDLDGLAATISACDMVVSIANVTADLAGALGADLKVLLAQRSDWRWQLAGPESIWYPSAHLYRRGAAASWQAVLDQLQHDINVALRR